MSAIEARGTKGGGKDGTVMPTQQQNGVSSSTPLWQEYESVLADCQNVYFGCRGQLLMPSVRSAVTELSEKYK